MSACPTCSLIWKWHGLTAASKKMMAKYANPLVLILDEWLLLKPTGTGAEGYLRAPAQEAEEIVYHLLFTV